MAKVIGVILLLAFLSAVALIIITIRAGSSREPIRVFKGYQPKKQIGESKTIHRPPRKP